VGRDRALVAFDRAESIATEVYPIHEAISGLILRQQG
jgi:hypothetical protein